MGTMPFKRVSLAGPAGRGGRWDRQAQREPEVHPRRQPKVRKPKVAQLSAIISKTSHVHGAWEGPARLHLIPHVNCRVADLPVRRIVGGATRSLDFVLPYGRVLHDYLALTLPSR